MPLRLDVPVAYLAANISIPIIAPFLSLAEIETGSFVRTGAFRPLTSAAIRQYGLTPFLGDVIVGVLVFAPALALLGGALTYGFAKLGQKLRNKSAA